MITGMTRISYVEVQLAEANSVPVVQVTTVTDMDGLAKIKDTKLKKRGEEKVDSGSKQNCLLHEYLKHLSSDLKRPFMKKMII